MASSDLCEANQASSSQPSLTEDNIGMEPKYYNAAAKGETEEANQASSSQPSLTEDNIGMEPKYYNAAAKGEFEVFKDLEPLNQLLTPNRNTILHIRLTSMIKDSDSLTVFVKKILYECPSLLRQANVKGETPLHIAARYGHARIVKFLIERAKRLPQEDLESGVSKTVKEMLEMTNNEKDTAFHEAVRGNHFDVVKHLIQEGPDISYSQNDAGETPLYIAVERGFEEVMVHILDKCKSPAHDGPLGRTTLHAAVTWDNIEMTQNILGGIAQDQSAFIKKVDKQCWTPLHCAAYFGSSSSAEVLLKVDRSIAYMKDAKGMTALHIAAHRGYHSVMESILEYCPDCCELVDERGWNALHFVMNSSSSIWADDEAEYILKNSSLSNLLNEKDYHGNTPLHHHSKSLHYIKDVVCHDRVDKMAFNKQNLNAYDVALTSAELSDKKFMQITRALCNDIHHRAEFRRPLGNDILPKRKNYKLSWNADWETREAARKAARKAACKAERKARKSIYNCYSYNSGAKNITIWSLQKPLSLFSLFTPYFIYSYQTKDRFVSIMEKASKTHLVVDTLIATVAFTAGITMPGGFIGQEGPHSGSPVLIRNTAFKAFIITNTIAMVQSCSAAFIHLFMPLLFDEQNLGDFSFLLASLAFCLSISAMGAMVLAFVTGTYAALMHSLGLAIANSVIGLLFFFPVFFVSIGCLDYLLEILRKGSSWILDRLCDLKDCILNGRFCILCIIAGGFLCALSVVASFFLVVNETGWRGRPL